MTNQPILPVLSALAGRTRPRSPQPGKFRRAGDTPDAGFYSPRAVGLAIGDVGEIVLDSTEELA